MADGDDASETMGRREGLEASSFVALRKLRLRHPFTPSPRLAIRTPARATRIDREAAQGNTGLPGAKEEGNLLRMKTRSLPFSLAFFLAASLGSPAAEPKLEPLFNGKDLTHFKAEGAQGFWRVEDGVLIGENDAAKKGHYLWTEKEYGDFILEFDVRWKTTTDRGVDTGIEMRKPNLQLQLGVSGSLLVDMTGSFYTGGKTAYPEAGQAKEAKKLLKPEGEWNTFRIQAKGDTFTCWINGQKAAEYTDPKYSGAAPLGLQIHGGVEMKCEYRKMKLAEL
jgi:hypothetical protein